ncbi:MFS general substrate transporter [Bimuria novae-zelandiae CBS 107.79]|uniref:MFS general substrate transporter n=1 Tax=Bimuria novae-zelandiae CBS 107.79 TaxID=1447943 RepID=A0A6A5V8J1_9PLEO|nr:MFS general substrate transporter [Bimuria novae-zelandiae CBS 107.79]
MVHRIEVEEQRLLEATSSSHDEKAPDRVQGHGLEEKVTWRDLPQKKQLLLLALCRLSTPLSNACLLPYIYFLVKSVLSDPGHPSASKQISRLTGLLVAAYPLGQMSTSMMWGRLSDTYGRKPIILLGLLISVTANLAFGFSRTIGILLFWRVLAGMANGILGVMRTMTAEIVKERKYHSRAFLALTLVFNSGRVAALAIGGCLADPVDNLPWLFGPTGILNFHKNPDGVAWVLKYPYALPALFNGTVLVICFMLAALWLKESFPAKEKSWDPGLAIGKAIAKLITRKAAAKVSGYTPLQIEEANSLVADVPMSESVSDPPIPLRGEAKLSRPRLRDIWTRRLLKTLLAFGLLPLHNATFLYIFPVFLSMPTSANIGFTAFCFTGGLGLASPTVGFYLASFGICGIFLQMFIYPRIQKHIGNLGAFRLASAIFPIAYVFAPYLSLVSGHETIKWVAMAFVLFFQVMARTMAMPSSVILLTEAAPRRSVLGTVHGAGSTLSALSSAAGPVIGGVLLARGIEIGAMGLVWWSWLSLVSLAALVWSFVLEKDEQEKGVSVGAQLE